MVRIKYLYMGGNIMEYCTTEEIAEKWKISRRRVTVLCNEGRIKGVIRKANVWLIPFNAEKPKDGRKNRYSNLKKK